MKFLAQAIQEHAAPSKAATSELSRDSQSSVDVQPASQGAGFAHDFSHIPARYEQEADSVADHVMRANSPLQTMPRIQSVAQRSIQCQSNRDALRARLQQVRATLTQLRAREAQLRDDDFTQVRQRESLEGVNRQMQAQSRSATAARSLFGEQVVVNRVRRAVTVSRSGNSVNVTANMQITYLALSDADGRQQAATDIPRIAAAIRDVWQVNITSGEYAGVMFRLLPAVTYLPRSSPRANNSFLIEVRPPIAAAPNDVFQNPSDGNPTTGIISLNPGHLQGARVIVVAHELLHLFGFLPDAYAPPLERGGRRVGFWSVARDDAANRADLLGLIDPAVLQRLLSEGSARPEDVARQSGTVRIWEREASIVLGSLGVEPPAPQPPMPDSEDFDPAADLQRERREGEARLAPYRARRQRAESAVQWLQTVEQIMTLEREERDLNARLSGH